MVGGMALFCLALFTALVFESGRDARGSQLQLDVPTEEASQQSAGPDSNAETQEESPRNTSVFAAESNPIPSGIIMALEQAAEEPLEVELNRLLDAIQQGFGESSIQIAPSLRPYAFRLAGRMNIRPGAFRVRVASPREDLAIARAEVLGRLFESAGVVSSRITFVPRTGIHSLTADPA